MRAGRGDEGQNFHFLEKERTFKNKYQYFHFNFKICIKKKNLYICISLKTSRETKGSSNMSKFAKFGKTNTKKNTQRHEISFWFPSLSLSVSSIMSIGLKWTPYWVGLKGKIHTNDDRRLMWLCYSMTSLFLLKSTENLSKSTYIYFFHNTT